MQLKVALDLANYIDAVCKAGELILSGATQSVSAAAGAREKTAGTFYRTTGFFTAQLDQAAETRNGTDKTYDERVVADLVSV